MKKLLTLIIIAAITIGGLLNHVHKINKGELIGPEISGFKINACYQLKSDNDPFDNNGIIIKVLNVKQGFYQYVYWDNIIIGFLNYKKSDSVKWRNTFVEIDCPKSIWGRI